MATLALLVLQYLVAAGAFLWPRLPPAQRRQLSPLHMYLGRAVFAAGLATMAVRWTLLAAALLLLQCVPSNNAQQCACCLHFVALQVGIQEKQTFVQAFGHPESVYVAVMRLPALLVLLLLLLALAVLSHHVPEPSAVTAAAAGVGSLSSSAELLAPEPSSPRTQHVLLPHERDSHTA